MIFIPSRGVKPNSNGDLHINSTHFDDEEAINMVNQDQYALSFPGYKDNDNEIIYLGGKDKNFKNVIKKELQKEGFNSKEAPSEIEGKDGNNMTNCTKQDAGVQIELTTKVRKAFFVEYNWSKSKRENRENWTPKIYDMANAITEAEHKINDEG